MGCGMTSFCATNDLNSRTLFDSSHRCRRTIDPFHSKNNENQALVNKLSNRNPFAVGSIQSVALELLGKQRYIGDAGALAMEMRQDSMEDVSCNGTLVVFAAVRSHDDSVPETSTSADNDNEEMGTSGGKRLSMSPRGITFAFRDSNGYLFVREISDEELAREKDSAMITHGWAPFFKSIASDVIKYKAVMVHSTPSRKEIRFNIKSTKDPTVQSYSVYLDLKSKVPSSRELLAYVIEPMIKMVQIRRIRNDPRERQVYGAEICKVVSVVNMESSKSVIKSTLPQIHELKNDLVAKRKVISDQMSKVVALERRIKKASTGAQYSLDDLYTVGTLCGTHTEHAEPYIPLMPEPSEPLADAIQAIFPMSVDDLPEDNTQVIPVLQRTPKDPYIQRIMASCPPTMVENVFNILSHIDCWDLNVFQLEEVTGGNALFYITYSLLHKMDLVSHFNIDDKILRNFLKAVQAGYHPNPYHNKTHAADVAHVNYYFMVPCGLGKICQLSNARLLAGILAGAIHDFDHPGLNNNFHTRVNAYLSTLYNDRSILENHHCACVFEIMRLPQYDILKNLSEEDYRTARDTIIEMVLATDMGNHGKIFNEFKKRLHEEHNWYSRNEDVKLALSMSIKMADISNSGRSKPLYLAWAKRIADEFYSQGDLEGKLNMSISPFMNRAKHDSEFSTGQISFINYIVMPMIESMADFLPKFNHAIDLCNKNKAHWE